MAKRFLQTAQERFFTELDRGGGSAWQVARRMGINPSTAYRWAAARRELGAPKFAQVVRATVVQDEVCTTGVAVRVGKVAVLVDTSFDPVVLRAVVAALSEEPR